MKGIPSFGSDGGGVSWLVDMLPILVISMIVGLILMMILKIKGHRVLVERLNIVSGGYVITSARYCKKFDKSTKMYFLSPIFGNKRLPDFPPECFQKINGMPFFGIQRQISLIFKNELSPVVSLPDGEAVEKNIKRWYFMEERTKFMKKLKRGDLVYFLSIFTPTIIIFGALLFWAFTMYLQAGIMENLGDRINDLTNSLLKWIEKT